MKLTDKFFSHLQILEDRIIESQATCANFYRERIPMDNIKLPQIVGADYLEKLQALNLKYSEALKKIARATICHDSNVGVYCTLNATVIVAKRALENTKEDL